MAVDAATWLKCDPRAGIGNGSTNLQAYEHTGRVERLGVVVIKSQTSDESVKINVTQEARPEFIKISTLDSGTVPTLPGGKRTTSYNVMLETNGDQLTLVKSPSTAGGVLIDYLPSSAIINGKQYNFQSSKISSIDGDPGAEASYTVSLNLDAMPENNSPQAITCKFGIRTRNSDILWLEVTVAGVGESITASSGTLVFSSEKSQQKLNITSNTSWQVDIQNQQIVGGA